MITTGKVVTLIQAMGGGADPAVIESAVQDWLEDHPEATTTVQDGSITEQKLATSIAQKLGLISSLSEEIVKVGYQNNALVNYGAGYIESGFYFEEGNASGTDLYFKINSGYFGFFLKNGMCSKTMPQTVADLEATTVTTPSGVTGCLQIPNNTALVYDCNDNKMKYVNRSQVQNGQIPLFFNSYGRAENLHPTLLEAKMFIDDEKIKANTEDISALQQNNIGKSEIAGYGEDGIVGNASGNAVVFAPTIYSKFWVTADADASAYVSSKNMFGTYTLGKYYASNGQISNGANNFVVPPIIGIPGESYTISTNKTVSNIGLIVWKGNTVSRRANNQNINSLVVTLADDETSFACWIDEDGSKTATDESVFALQPQIEYGTKRTEWVSGSDQIKLDLIANTQTKIDSIPSKTNIIQVLGGSVSITYSKSASAEALIVNVRDYGASGDGATDDTQAIQSAIDAAHAQGKDVFIPAGTYLLATALFSPSNTGVSHCLEVYSDQRIYGEKGTVLKRGSSASNHLMFTHNESNATGYTGAENITIERITFDSNSSAYTTANTPLNLSHARNIKIIDCTFENSTGGWHSIEINSSQFVEVAGCEFLNNVSNAEDIQIDGAAGTGNLGANDNTVCSDIDIHNCRFASGGSVPAVGNHTNMAHKNIRIHENVFASASSASRGIIDFVALTEKVDVYGNTFYASDIGVRFQNSTANSTVHDNRFESVTTPHTGGTVAYNNMVDGALVNS